MERDVDTATDSDAARRASTLSLLHVAMSELGRDYAIAQLRDLAERGSGAASAYAAGLADGLEAGRPRRRRSSPGEQPRGSDEGV